MTKWKNLEKVSLVALLAAVCFISLSDGVAVMSVDLGGQFLKVAIVKPGVPMDVALNKESRRKTPVVVTLRDDERLYGDAALGMSVKYPKTSYLYICDLLGKKMDNPLVETFKQRFPYYDLVEDESRGTVQFQHNSDTRYSPEELLAMLLNTTREIAESFADHPIKDAVITVPAFFNQAERRAVVIAAHMVGLNVLQLINDNVAVALNYGVFRRSTFNGSEKLIMFYDMGATSTEATIVGYSTVDAKDRGLVEKAPQLSVKSVGFDRTLGGREFDFRLRDHLIKLFQAAHKTSGDITKSPRAMAKFLKEAMRVKQVLSANSEFYAQIEGAFEEKDFRAKVTRVELEEMCRDLLDRVSGPVEKALKSSGITLDEIDSVILVGGGTRMPKVQEILLKAVKKQELGKSINADEAAALGAVYQAANLATGFRVKKFVIKDANIYPIQVSFERKIKDENGQDGIKYVKRTLFHHLNTMPQRKVMTFNKHVDDFAFHVGYNDMNFLNENELKMHGDMNLTTVSLKGVADALAKHTPAGESKGVKAYFRMDESSILTIEKVESVFEKMPEEEEEVQSTFSKLGSKISSFFTGAKGEETADPKTEEEKDKTEDTKTPEENGESEEKVTEEKTEQENTSEEKKDEEKTTEKEEEKTSEEEKTEEEAETKSTDDAAEKTDSEEKSTDKAEEKIDEKSEEKTEEKKDEKTEEKKDEKTEDKKDDNTTDSGNKTESAGIIEKKVIKPVTVRELLDMTINIKDLTAISDDGFVQSKKKLEDLTVRDLQKAENEKAKNALESFIFKSRDTISSDLGESLTTEEEREKINTVLSETSDWLDDDGWDSTADVYEGKLKTLKESTDGMYFRKREHAARPQAVEGLLKSLNLSQVFLKQVQNMTDKDEIYAAKDLTDMDKLNNDTQEWLEKMVAKQKETKPSDKPVLLVKDIEYRQSKMERELLFLLNKAKYFVPKPKPKAENTTESANNTTEFKPKDSNKTDKADDKTTETKTEETVGEKAETKTETTEDEKVETKAEEKVETTAEESNEETKANDENTNKEETLKEAEKEPILELPSPTENDKEKPTVENTESASETVNPVPHPGVEATDPVPQVVDSHHEPVDEL